MRTLTNAGARLLALDVTDDASMSAAVDTIVRDTGRIPGGKETFVMRILTGGCRCGATRFKLSDVVDAGYWTIATIANVDADRAARCSPSLQIHPSS